MLLNPRNGRADDIDDKLPLTPLLDKILEENAMADKEGQQRQIVVCRSAPRFEAPVGEIGATVF